jgi:uncharacterized membrane protein YagU involved in acid resistance
VRTPKKCSYFWLFAIFASSTPSAMAQKFKMTEDFKRAAKGIIIYVITTLVFFPLYHLIKGDFSWGETWSYALIQIIVAVVIGLFFFFGMQIPKKNDDQ